MPPRCRPGSHRDSGSAPGWGRSEIPWERRRAPPPTETPGAAIFRISIIEQNGDAEFESVGDETKVIVVEAPGSADAEGALPPSWRDGLSPRRASPRSRIRRSRDAHFHIQIIDLIGYFF